MGIGAGALILGTVIYAAIDSRIAHIKDEINLKNYLNNNKLALVEFYNPSCPVCQMFNKSKILSQAAEALPHIGFAMISKDDAPELMPANQIEYFPTFIYFKDGKEFYRKTGYTSTFTHDVGEKFAQEKG
jgi:thiol-disulfide isomerase/thioredoxin